MAPLTDRVCASDCVSHSGSVVVVHVKFKSLLASARRGGPLIAVPAIIFRGGLAVEKRTLRIAGAFLGRPQPRFHRERTGGIERGDVRNNRGHTAIVRIRVNGGKSDRR